MGIPIISEDKTEITVFGAVGNGVYFPDGHGLRIGALMRVRQMEDRKTTYLYSAEVTSEKNVTLTGEIATVGAEETDRLIDGIIRHLQDLRRAQEIAIDEAKREIERHEQELRRADRVYAKLCEQILFLKTRKELNG